MHPTNKPDLRCWIDSANDGETDFPIQNLPYGVFRRAGSGEPRRVGVAIGDSVLDLAVCAEAGLVDGLPGVDRSYFAAPVLNPLMTLARGQRVALRERISELLSADTPTLRDNKDLRARALAPIGGVEMSMPADVGDYTDFYASKHHATNVGSMFRPDNPLLPNYTHIPIAYHGRASSVVVSGTPIRRPRGQTKADDAPAPAFGPCRLLDYEMEVGFFTSRGNPLGDPIPVGRAEEHLFGMCLVNDWSARDIQKWEYQPLGPFLSKSFATTVSPWVVTVEALEPFRVAGPPRGAEDPEPLEYLRGGGDWAIDMTVEVYLRSAQMRQKSVDAVMLSRGNFKSMYWTIDQMLAHHASNGCPMRPGDLLASGTVSGPEKGSRGCMLELTWRGSEPVELPTGEQRKFLADGDEVTLRAYCRRDGAARIGLGDCAGVVLPAHET